jgi:predicted nucleic acid-binding protein
VDAPQPVLLVGGRRAGTHVSRETSGCAGCLPPDQRLSEEDLHAPALIDVEAASALRDNFTVHDAAYVVLAQALDAPLVTADITMQEAQRLGVEVRVVR